MLMIFLIFISHLFILVGKILFGPLLGTSDFICLFNLLIKTLEELIVGPNEFNLSNLFSFL